MNVTYASARYSVERQIEIARVFQIIRKTGPLTPARVEEYARNPKSTLHEYFEWDDKKAGKEHRLFQARELIASVKIKIVADPKQKPKTVRAFVHVMTKAGSDYVDTIAAMSNADHRAQVVAQALAEMQVFERKYKDLSELADIFAALGKVRSRVKKRSAA